jgi:phage-related protein
MDLPKKKIAANFYELPGGNAPVRDWLLEMDEDDRRTIGKDLQYLEYCWPVGMPKCRPMGNGLWELRSNISQNRISRVLFAILEGRMVLLHAFIKKSAQTPKQDLALAMERLSHLKKT